jgi:hypothetical protein
MAYEHREGFGNIFRHDKKGNASAPDWSGDIMVCGRVLKLAVWEKEGKNGKFFSCKLDTNRLPNQGRQDAPHTPAATTTASALDDGEPF